MTYRQSKLTKTLPKSKTYKEAMLKAGYSEKTSNLGKYGISRNKNLLGVVRGDKEVLEQCEADFNGIYQQAIGSKDLSNACRAKENITRMHAGFTDKTINDTTLRTAEDDAILNKHSNRIASLIPKQTEKSL